MRAAIVGFLSIFAFTSAEAQDWTTLSLGTSSDLNAIEKTSFSMRYVVGDGGFVAQSDDGSQLDWTPVDVGTSADLLAVHQPAFGQVWIGGAAGTCRRLVTGSWEGRNIPNGAEDFVVFSRSSGWSYAAGTGGSIYRSTDSGVSWSPQSSGTANALHAGNGFVGSTAICVGDLGTILKTTDGGTLWTPKTSGTSANLHAYVDVGGGGIVVAGESGMILRSADGGESWAPVSSGTSETLYDLDTSGQNANWVLAVGANGTCRQSIDAGQTWCTIETGTTVDLYACDMVLNGTWVIAGAGGLMKRTENAGGGCVISAVDSESWGRVKAKYR